MDVSMLRDGSNSVSDDEFFLLQVAMMSCVVG